MDDRQDQSATSSPGRDGDNSGAQSVDRAVTVLELIARSGDASVSEVAIAVGVHRSTISRLLAVLELRGMVELTGTRGRYRLGMNILRLAEAVTGALEITTQGAAPCLELSAGIGETVNVAVRQGDSAVNVYQAEGAGAVTVDSWVGRRTPLHATSSGKVLLAWSHRGQSAELESEFPRFTAQTITDPQVLRAQLARARTDGWATTLGELEDGLNAIAAPVFAANGSVIGALSASGPAYRWTADAMLEHAGEVVAAADRVSALMGYRG